MKIYALTGGIGSGKSEASRRFEERGIPVIDADRIGHTILEPGGAAEQAVIAAFGTDIVTCGRIDREKLGGIVFADSDALKRLNSLTHPAVRGEIARRTAEYMEVGHEAIIIEAALHAENGELGPEMSGLILVTCPTEERIRRLVELRGMDRDEAERRIAAQTPPENKARLAKWIVDNRGTLEELYEQVDAVAEEL